MSLYSPLYLQKQLMFLEEIASAGGEDGMIFGAQQGDILHDHLSADMEMAGQAIGGHWLRLLV